MRRALIAFTLLFLLAAGGVAAVHMTVNEVRDQVVITEEVLFGDKAAAEGLTILSEAALDDGRLNWDTTYTIGSQPETHTDFEFRTEREDRAVTFEHSGLMLSGYHNRYSGDWRDSTDGAGLSGLNLAYWELMQDTPVGEEGKRDIRIADYYDYYPFEIVIELPNYYLHVSFGEISMAVSQEQHDNMAQVHEKLKQYLKIPVLPTETMEISLTRTEYGVGGWGSGTGDGERYESYAKRTVTDEACYFVPNNRTNEDNLVDFSHVPGGYGIHMLRYRYREGDTITMVDADSLSMVYPLDEESRVLWFDHTTGNDRLLLVTLEESGETLLRVIDCDGMETVQEIVLYEKDEVRTFGVAECIDNFVLLRANDGWITLLEERGDGTFDVAIDIPVTEEQQVSYGFHTVHWDGEKLVLAYPWARIDWQSQENCGFGVAVYDKTGALFVGKYTSSLDTKTYHYYSGDNCFLWSEEPLHISWK